MVYIDKIKEIISNERIYLGRPSPLTSPIIVMMLGLDSKTKENMYRELRDRWTAMQRYIYLFDIQVNANIDKHKKPEIIPDPNVIYYRFTLPKKYKDQDKFLLLGHWMRTVINNAFQELGTMRCSIHVVTAAQEKAALWSGRCAMLMHHCISLLGGSVEKRNLFALMKSDLALYGAAQKAFADVAFFGEKAWRKQLPTEGMFPLYDANMKIAKPVRLLPCTTYFSPKEQLFNRYILLDEKDSSGLTFSMEERIHMCALMMDPNIKFTWSNGATDEGVFSAYLYPRYAEQHQTDIALAWSVCRERLQEAMTNEKAKLPDLTNTHDNLLQWLNNSVLNVSNSVKGFRMGALQNGNLKESNTAAWEKAIYGKALRNEMDYLWIRSAIELRDVQIPNWRDQVRKKLAGVCSKPALEQRNSLYPKPENAQKEIKFHKVEKKYGKPDIKTYPQTRITVARDILESIYPGEHRARIEAVITGKGLEEDPVLSAVLDRCVDAEMDNVIDDRINELNQVFKLNEQMKNKQQEAQGTFEGELRKVLSGAEFDLDARTKEIGELLDDDIVRAYADALNCGEDKVESEIAKLFERIYRLFIDSKFEPIKRNTPQTPDRIGCQLIGAIKVNNAYSSIEGGLDHGLKLYIEEVEQPIKVRALNSIVQTEANDAKQD